MAHTQVFNGRILEPAIVAHLTGREPRANLLQRASVPLGLVLKVANELTPADIHHALRESVIFDHVRDLQILDADEPELAHKGGAGLVQKILAEISDSSVDASKLGFRFLTTRTAFFASREGALSFL